ncbi:hypothetical protein EV132_101448 [Rhizobium sullae]|uniref:Uncharacterized protein n=1 Tax=Rhizobium sullae TaxID=50338 RepID=A0A4R3QFV6_RHISU|nr:hypothetical protein EV132_101448 [Rhizobium sullae]
MSFETEMPLLARHGSAFLSATVSGSSRQPENRIWQVYDLMPDAVFFLNGGYRTSTCNRTAVALFGYLVMTRTS